MAGLFGIADTRGADQASKRFGVLKDRMLRHPRSRLAAASSIGDRCHVGHVQIGPTSEPRTQDRSDRPTALFHGVLYNETTIAKSVRSPRFEGSTSELIGAAYASRGRSAVTLLDGAYALAVLDRAEQQVLISTDATGSHPIYWRVDPDGLVFASDLSAVIAATPAVRHLNLASVADYLTIGAVLGDKTLAEGVHVLEPGTTLVYDLRTNQTTIGQFARLDALFHGDVLQKSDYLEVVTSAFDGAVRRAMAGADGVGLSLSGGLDSRAILSSMNGQAPGVCTYTLGVEGCADQVIARQLADIAHTRHVYFKLDNAYLRDFLPHMTRMVSITDGMYLSHGLTEMLALEFLEATGIKVLLRGHGGELAKAHLAWPLHTDQHVYSLSSNVELVQYLSERANYVTPGLALSQVFTRRAAAAAGDGTRTSFAKALQGLDLTPAQCCSYLYLKELHRRFTIPSLELFRTQVEVRLPYLDSEFLRALLPAPPEWRDSTEIHRALTAKGIPPLLKVRNSNTGARADAGTITEFVMDKCNSALKRLNVWGYRHYHNFDAWMRTSLLESVEAELMGPLARVQAFVPKPVLQELIRETRGASADRSYLLQVLLILELWQRENGIEAAA